MNAMLRGGGAFCGAMMFALALMVVAVGMLFLVGGDGLKVTSVAVPAVQRASVPAIEWTGLGEHVVVPPGMAVREHANKHEGQVLDAWKIYTLLLEGQCVASAVFCGPSDIEKLYLCVDLTGRIGGLIVFGGEILTGYQASQDDWAKKVDKPQWEVCGE